MTPQTGELGVAVQSHWFAVGPIVPWARAGVGAVATQSVAEPAYGPRLLDRLADGEHPQRGARRASSPPTRRRATARSPSSTRRGARPSTRGTGASRSPGDERGTGFSAQANMMAAPEVWPAMAAAFDGAAGPLARRLLAALHAAEAHGGDVRGRQSAALLVVPAEGEAWRTSVDLRIDDDPEPLVALDRLLDLHDAYDLATLGDDLTGEGRHDEAGDAYARASALAPDNHELLFWAGLAPRRPATCRSRSSACAGRSSCGPRGRTCCGACSRTSRRRRSGSARRCRSGGASGDTPMRRRWLHMQSSVLQ